MRTINANSPNQALQDGLYHLHFGGILQESRAGRVIVSRDPVMTVYSDPTARVLVGRTRDANPFFHLFESLWMLAGRNDLAFPKTFVSTFGQFSDDGETLNGAYGHRWRNHFGYDQLELIIEELKANPSTRRAVLQMWDGGAPADTIAYPGDLRLAISGSADVPCNTAAYFDTVDGKLNMTVTCRSNDVILGAYGANLVHFSVLLEYMALATGIPIGKYRQYSNNFHVYESQLERAKFCAYADSVAAEDVYLEPLTQGIRGRMVKRKDAVRRIPLWDATDGKVAFDEDVSSFMTWVDGWDLMNAIRGPWTIQQTSFFRHVVVPMAMAWSYWKEKQFHDALDMADTIKAGDWRAACREFIRRRMETQNA